MIVLASLVTVGCAKELSVEPVSGSGLRFSVVVPPSGAISTRSFASEAVTSLHVLVFDENGYFVECQKAVPAAGTTWGADMNSVYSFTVSLQASASKRILHFVANYDFDAHPVEYGTEYSVVSHLTVGGGQEAYWQRVVLDGGIYTQENLDSMPEADKAKLVKIPLVRNFAKIVVESKTHDFTVTGFALWNVPDRGCVAPCVMAPPTFATYGMDDTDGDQFAANPWISRTYEAISGSFGPNDTDSVGYSGFLPAAANIVSTDANALTYDMTDKYMYERPYSGDLTHTAVIVKGRYNGEDSEDKDTYFKVDLIRYSQHGRTEYYNILRNFTYKVNINSCTDDGYATAAEAAAQPASNNFVSSVVTQDVINISDGEARLYVSTTDTTVVSSEPFRFRYKYVPDFYGDGLVDNTKVSFYDYTRNHPLTRDDASIYYVELDPPYSVMEKYNVVDKLDAPGSRWHQWHETTIVPTEPGDEEVSETVIIYQETDDGTQVKIARSVTFRLRKPFEMIAECVPSVLKEGVGDSLVVNIKIPSGLREALFPLEFVIEADNNSITPNTDWSSADKDPQRPGYLSAWYGKSIIPGKETQQTYGFKKRLFYPDYLKMSLSADNSHRIVPCAFKTTKSKSATKIWIQNKYFAFGDGKSTAEFTNK